MATVSWRNFCLNLVLGRRLRGGLDCQSAENSSTVYFVVS